MDRASGILMPIFSLPGKYGIGTLGKHAKEFVDFLNRAGQRYWQVLPIGPSGSGNSPYSSYSSFAGNPNLIDFELLIDNGLLSYEDINCNWGIGKIDYNVILKYKLEVLKTAYKKFLNIKTDELELFKSNNEWVNDYAFYISLKEHFKMSAWTEWEDSIKKREKEALDKYSYELKEEIDFHIFVQYIFFSQWEELKQYANKSGISIIGDLPIYVALDSADVWVSPESFLLDDSYMPYELAGVPPDYFSKTGQLWGNPIYNWELMKNDGYGWWIRRMDRANNLFDVIRIDHFRGLSSYWSVSAGEKTAVNGRWEKGPGIDLINRLKGWFGDLNIIAEDLGILTEDVKDLLNESGFPGMKVIEFAFDKSRNSDYLPHKYNTNCVCYVGTHDNATLREWKEYGDHDEVEFAMEYFGIDKLDEFEWGIIRGGMASVAKLFITQMQDYLMLGRECRMNIPGVADGNWNWRMEEGAASKELADKIAYITKMYGRDR